MESAHLLSTGEVARLLGSSRQHVVDLCDRGDLPCVRAGTHRRVPRAAVERLRDDGGGRLTREQERSLWLHRAVCAALVTDPTTTIDTARRNLASWRDVHMPGGMSKHWLRQWTELLDQGVDDVADMLTSHSPLAIDMRQNSPFAGALTPGTRTQVLASFKQHWRLVHGTQQVP